MKNKKKIRRKKMLARARRRKELKKKYGPEEEANWGEVKEPRGRIKTY